MRGLCSFCPAAIVLLCLLHTAVGQFHWNGPSKTTPSYEDPTKCLLDHASCGCCLMERQLKRMKWFANITITEIQKELNKLKMGVTNIRASRSAFSVALNNGKMLSCFGPFGQDQTIIYKHVFLNMGGGYDLATGTFTVPRSGIYSLAVTIYSRGGAYGTAMDACANLQVNGQVVYKLYEKSTIDTEDSATVVMAMKLRAMDQVAVSLPKGCLICDSESHYNTFTGFLLYATD